MVISCVSSSFFFWAVLRLFVVVVVDGAEGASQFFVTDGRPKCFKVEVPHHTDVEVFYEAPNIRDDEGLNLSYLTLQETVSRDVLDLMRREQQKRKIPIANQKPVSHEMRETKGSLKYTTHDQDAFLNICVRSANAKPTNPLPYHIRVEEMTIDIEDFFTDQKKKHAPLLDVEHHWSFLETQLDRIEHEMHNIINEAYYYRERDAMYNQKMDDLNKATSFWPMLQCCILLLTGFTQANHIVAFFKKRRII